MDYSKIDMQKIHTKRHLEIAVVSVEADVLTLKVADQYYFGDEFSKQENKHEFTAKNGLTIRLGEKLEWDESNEILSLRRFRNINTFEETIECNVHKIADILAAINEYNETNGNGYENPWPQTGDLYYYVDTDGSVESCQYADKCDIDNNRRESGNFFATKEAAKIAAERVKKALKGVDENKLLREALEEAVAVYGKPGGPWNVPGDAGGWLDRARKALEVGNE